MSQLIDGIVKNEKVDPKVRLKDDDRITLEGTTREKMNNISIQLSNLDFSDTGKYTCHVKNPKERAEHNATVFLQVVDKCVPGKGTWAVQREGFQGACLSVTVKWQNRLRC
jgi:hypothetical protein